MKYARIWFFLVFSFLYHPLFANQQHIIDSLNATLPLTKNDLQRTAILYQLSESCMFFNPVKAEQYAEEGIQLAEKTGDKDAILKSNYILHSVLLYKCKYAEALDYGKKTMALSVKAHNDTLTALVLANISVLYNNLENIPEAQKNCYEAIKLSEKLNFQRGLVIAYNNLGSIYQLQDRNDEALKQHRLSFSIAQKINFKLFTAGVYHNMAVVFYYQQKYDTALVYVNKALEINKETENRLWESYNYNFLGALANTKGNNKEALRSLFASLELTQEMDDKAMENTALINIGDTYFQMKDYANAKKYTEQSIQEAAEANEKYGLEISYSNLSDIDSAMGNWKSAYKNQLLSKSYHDTLVNAENTKKLLESSMLFEFEKKEAMIKANQDKKDAIASGELQKQHIIKNVSFAGLAIVLLFAFISYRRFTEKRKANEILESTLENLKNTQAQLVQSEKMAAFGVVASRVAHEIQNPLNFVNNFSELSEDLLHDIIHTTNDHERNDAAEKLTANLQKINEHGKRAASIIKELQSHTKAGTAHEFFEK